jgi:hypothetical protein
MKLQRTSALAALPVVLSQFDEPGQSHLMAQDKTMTPRSYYAPILRSRPRKLARHGSASPPPYFQDCGSSHARELPFRAITTDVHACTMHQCVGISLLRAVPQTRGEEHGLKAPWRSRIKWCISSREHLPQFLFLLSCVVDPGSVSCSSPLHSAFAASSPTFSSPTSCRPSASFIVHLHREVALQLQLLPASSRAGPLIFPHS